MSVEDRIKSLIEPLRSELAGLEKERLSIRTELDVVEEQIRKIEKVLRAADPDSVPARKAKDNGGTRVSEGNLDNLLRIFWRDPHVTQTQETLVKETGFSISTISEGLVELRARGQIRSIGRIPNPHRKGPGVLGFKIGENVPPPEPKPKSKRRQIPSEPTLEEMRKAARTIEDDTFTLVQVRDITRLPKSTVGFGFQALVDRGDFILVEKARGAHGAVYRLSDGS